MGIVACVRRSNASRLKSSRTASREASHNLDSESTASNQADNEDLLPCVGECLSEDGKDTEKTSEEDNASATKIVVEEVIEPCWSIAIKSLAWTNGFRIRSRARRTEKTSRNSETRIDYTDQHWTVCDAKFYGICEVGSVCTSIVPTLYRRTKREHTDCTVESEGVAPLVRDFSAQSVDIFRIKALKVFE